MTEFCAVYGIGAIVGRSAGTGRSKRRFGLQFFLQDLLGRPVDLVADKALRPEVRRFIDAQALRV